MKFLNQVETEISSWPQVSVHSHRFGGKEFKFGDAEIGHVHLDGTVDIPFTRPIHNALLEEGLAKQHHWVPDSGWITFHIRSADSVKHASWLMRLSYLRYALKKDADPRAFLEHESEQLHLSTRFRELLQRFLPQNGSTISQSPAS
jgi:hypothetical protein